MACPICDHTMRAIGVEQWTQDKVVIFWCPRCGTIKANTQNPEHAIPMLVSRCQTLVLDAIHFTTDSITDIPAELQRRGITEAVTGGQECDVQF